MIHIPSAHHAAEVDGSGEALAEGESELDHLGLEVEAMEGWPLPRLATARVALWCTRYRIVELGPKPQALVIGQIQEAWWEDRLGEDLPGRIDLLEPLGRLAHSYVVGGEELEV